MSVIQISPATFFKLCSLSKDRVIMFYKKNNPEYMKVRDMLISSGIINTGILYFRYTGFSTQQACLIFIITSEMIFIIRRIGDSVLKGIEARLQKDNDSVSFYYREDIRGDEEIEISSLQIKSSLNPTDNPFTNVIIDYIVEMILISEGFMDSMFVVDYLRYWRIYKDKILVWCIKDRYSRFKSIPSHRIFLIQVGDEEMTITDVTSPFTISIIDKWMQLAFQFIRTRSISSNKSLDNPEFDLLKESLCEFIEYTYVFSIWSDSGEGEGKV